MSNSPVTATVVLNDMNRTEYALYGFRSWMLQDIDRPYEVVLNLFNDRRGGFDVLARGANPHCRAVINVFDPPTVFSIFRRPTISAFTSPPEPMSCWPIRMSSAPSHFLRRAMDELDRREICYCTSTRINLTPEQTDALKPADQYSQTADFDELCGTEYCPGISKWVGVSPWIVRRDIAAAVGGFDANVVCHEDADLDERVMHYLRRHKLQDVLYVLSDLLGYHMHHPPSELYSLSTGARDVFVPRRQRLRAAPDSTEDVVPTPLGSLESLLAEMRQVQPPEAKHLPDSTKLRSRVRRALRVLMKG